MGQDGSISASPSLDDLTSAKTKALETGFINVNIWGETILKCEKRMIAIILFENKLTDAET
jgi:hypothetical protein